MGGSPWSPLPPRILAASRSPVPRARLLGIAPWGARPHPHPHPSCFPVCWFLSGRGGRIGLLRYFSGILRFPPRFLLAYACLRGSSQVLRVPPRVIAGAANACFPPDAEWRVDALPSSSAVGSLTLCGTPLLLTLSSCGEGAKEEPKRSTRGNAARHLGGRYGHQPCAVERVADGPAERSLPIPQEMAVGT